MLPKLRKRIAYSTIVTIIGLLLLFFNENALPDWVWYTLCTANIFYLGYNVCLWRVWRLGSSNYIAKSYLKEL